MVAWSDKLCMEMPELVRRFNGCSSANHCTYTTYVKMLSVAAVKLDAKFIIHLEKLKKYLQYNLRLVTTESSQTAVPVLYNRSVDSLFEEAVVGNVRRNPAVSKGYKAVRRV